MENKIYYTPDENGELVEVQSNLVELQPGDTIRRKSQDEYYKGKINRNFTDTPFIWLKFIYKEELFSDLTISPQNLARLIYAATFCNEDGSLMRKKELVRKMRLTKPRWSEFWNEMVKNEVLYESDEIVYINTKYFSRGKIPSDTARARLFCKSVRELYESCIPTDHVQLSYIYKIIPYVNRRNNRVCKCPTQQDMDSICPMTVGEFCDAVGYNRDNARRLVNALLRFRIENRLALGFFVSEIKEESWIIVANPLLYFGGIKDEMYYAQLDLFNKEREKYLANNGIQHEAD